MIQNTTAWAAATQSKADCKPKKPTSTDWGEGGSVIAAEAVVYLALVTCWTTISTMPDGERNCARCRTGIHYSSIGLRESPSLIEHRAEVDT
jgi:hypothetical protein